MDDVDALLKGLAPRVLGALVRRHRDLADCEDALQEALVAAAREWPRELPAEPRAWLLRVAHLRLVDARRAALSREVREQVVATFLTLSEAPEAEREDSVELLFHCCQPVLSPASATALTLRCLGGLSTAELARAFLVPEATMAQRLSRARRTLAESPFSFELTQAERRARLPQVMRVVYLMFNEGYATSSGPLVHRPDLAREAIRLGRTLRESFRGEPEVMGLLALMLLTDARREARTGPAGELVPLDEQDRAKWDRVQIEEGRTLLESAVSQGQAGPYQVQAAIAALHDESPSTEETDWPQVVALYEVLERLTPGPVVALNRAVAVSMVEGPARGLELLDSLEALAGHHRLWAARGHLFERLGRFAEAADACERAAQGTESLAERDALQLKAARLRAR